MSKPEPVSLSLDWPNLHRALRLPQPEVHMSKPEPVSLSLDWPNPHRALRLPQPEVHHFTTEDGVGLRLVRYKGGDAGPVIFSHGNGTSNKMALLDTIDTNLAEYLVERGHDLWLFEWRGSPDLDHPGYSLYDVAKYDWPAAVRHVVDKSGASQVDCVAFCAGGMTLLIALAAGRLQGLVRSAASLQASLTFTMPWLPRLKSSVRLAELVELLGWRTYRQDAGNPSWPYRLLDGALKLHPTPHGEGCGNPSCQRMVFCYGPPVRHANLNDATHARLSGLYGRASVRSVCELAGAVRKGRIAPLDDAALDNLRLPLTFIHGEANKLLLPDSSRRLHDMLVARHGPAFYRLAFTPDYSHTDSLAGANAARDVFPVIGAHLDRWSKAPAAQKGETGAHRGHESAQKGARP